MGSEVRAASSFPMNIEQQVSEELARIRERLTQLSAAASSPAAELADDLARLQARITEAREALPEITEPLRAARAASTDETTPR